MIFVVFIKLKGWVDSFRRALTSLINGWVSIGGRILISLAGAWLLVQRGMEERADSHGSFQGSVQHCSAFPVGLNTFFTCFRKEKTHEISLKQQTLISLVRPDLSDQPTWNNEVWIRQRRALELPGPSSSSARPLECVRMWFYMVCLNNAWTSLEKMWPWRQHMLL